MSPFNSSQSFQSLLGSLRLGIKIAHRLGVDEPEPSLRIALQLDQLASDCWDDLSQEQGQGILVALKYFLDVTNDELASAALAESLAMADDLLGNTDVRADDDIQNAYMAMSVRLALMDLRLLSQDDDGQQLLKALHQSSRCENATVLNALQILLVGDQAPFYKWLQRFGKETKSVVPQSKLEPAPSVAPPSSPKPMPARVVHDPLKPLHSACRFTQP